MSYSISNTTININDGEVFIDIEDFADFLKVDNYIPLLLRMHQPENADHYDQKLFEYVEQLTFPWWDTANIPYEHPFES